MCGYQCDKAVTKNDTREVIWYHFTAVKWYHITSRFELSNQIDCNDLVGPIGLHVIFQLTPAVKFGGKNCFAVLSTKWPLQDLWMSPMKIFLSLSKRKKTRTRQEKLFDRIKLQEHFKRTIRLTFPSFLFYLHSYTIIKCNFLVLQLGGLIFFKHVTCNKQIITC